MPAWASPEGMRAAIAAMDVEALHAEAQTDAEKRLAAGIELGWTSQAPAAAAELSAALDQGMDFALKADGLRQLMSLYMRRGEFAAAASAGLRASVIMPLDAGERQALSFVEGLVSVPPTRAAGAFSGGVPVIRDLAGLMRADITVGEVSIPAILDTGANFSTINETSAARLGLRMLDAAVSVGSSSRDAVASRLAVADRLKVGEAEFSNVVFIVLPDADLSFANGAYTIDAILGMPVFLEMKRIAVTKTADGEIFAFGDTAPIAAGPEAKRNIRFAGLSPLVDVSVEAAGQSIDIIMMFDSGAQQTSFEGRFAEVAAHLLTHAATVTSTRGGAGGTVTSDDTKRLASVNLTFANRVVTLTNVDVHETKGDNRLGLLGLDAVANGFVIDWERGIFAPQ